ncbi:MAG TPA: bifunctional UDP-sugar hydrolase/5'-nucleotidase, partial [Thermoanaerobaculia bacterium]
MKRTLVLFILLLSACATVPSGPPVHLVIVGTTDVHGWFNGHVDRGVQYGGIPLFASYVSALRAEGDDHVVLVDSGDLFQGTLESNYFEGEPVVRAYNLLGYAAAAVGNHEFDYGPVGPDAIARVPGEDPLGALKKNAALARFPFLSANMTEKATGRTPSWARPYTMIDVAGVHLGIIGLSTPDTPNTTVGANVVTLNFGDPVKATVAAARDLRASGADAVIVIGHMGGRCADVKDVHDVASCRPEEEAMTFLQRLPHGTIDAYFAGHTHQQMRQIINGVPAVQALAYSVEFSTIDLWVDPSRHRVDPSRTTLRPLTMICGSVYSGSERCEPPRDASAAAPLVPRTFLGRTITPDPAVTSLLAPYLDRVAAKRSESIGVRTAALFTRSSTRESALGDLIADALRAAMHSDMAFMNSGGIRSNLRAGDLAYSDIFEVSPFDNYPAV